MEETKETREDLIYRLKLVKIHRPEFNFVYDDHTSNEELEKLYRDAVATLQKRNQEESLRVMIASLNALGIGVPLDADFQTLKDIVTQRANNCK